MKRLVAMVVAVGAALAAVAMPTKAELQKAQEMVSDVTAADVAALKAKTKKPVEVAAKHMELAGQAASEAEKYLLLQAAFKLYAKAGDYDAAANVIEKLQTEITDYDPEVTVELCGAEFIRKMRENAPRLYALKENARRIVFYRKQLPIREAAVKKNPKDAQAQRKLAECHAELGDWPKALDVFVKAGGELKKMAEGETSGKVPAQELGDFWWDYETKSDTAVYKLHAAELYRTALADDSFKGLARTRTEQRVKECEAFASFVVIGSLGDLKRPAVVLSKSLVLDLGCGQKLSFRLCPAGSFEMGGRLTGRPDADRKHKVTITRPFYCLPSFVQQSQWMAVMGGKAAKPSEVLVASRPEYEEFLQKLTKQFVGKIPRGYVFRFLTEAEYMYAESVANMFVDETSGFLLDLFGADQNRVWQRKPRCWKGSHGLDGDANMYTISSMDYEDAETDPLVYCRTYSSPKTLYLDFKNKQKKASPLRRPMWARIAIGPDLVAEKTAKPGAATATSVSPSDKKFSLAQGIDLEMVACPAGMFKMSNAPGGPNGDGTHEVKLTRTYWIASSCVTRAMYKVFEADYDKDEKKDGEKKPDDQVTGYARAEAFASWLNKRFQSKLPRGYVFRLPSEAEWEYAMNTGAVARHWGFEGTLDTVRAVSGKANVWKFDVSVMDYAAKESDPVRVYSQNPAWVCRQNAEKRFLLRMDGQGCFRMVLGPDLIAEKKAKGK